MMKNRGAIIGLLLVCMSLGTMMAQPSGKPSQEQREKRKARMKEMKKAFIKTELDLTEIEEQAFWPIYNEYENKLDALRKERRSLRKQFKAKSLGELSEAEAEEMITKEMKFRERRLALDKYFEQELKSSFSAKKIILLHKAERKFKKQLLDRMKGRRVGEGMDRRGRGSGSFPPGGPRN
jgi:Spy/CpxP family protein refolding chaperone